jgi:hypothetical protein
MSAGSHFIFPNELTSSRGSMRLPTLSRSRISLLGLLAASAFLGACSNDSTAPAVLTTGETPVGSSQFQPSAATRSLVGVSDGVYTFAINPKKQQTLYLGANALFIPANAVCDLSSSSYGAAHWTSKRPSIDFQPALRFAPDKNVMLYFWFPKGTDAGKRQFVMNYCNDARVCIDESLTDSSLTTYFDPSSEIVYRRIKHFSGYIIASGFSESGESNESTY